MILLEIQIQLLMSETFEIIINGMVDGERISPTTIDISLFRDYISDISSLVKEPREKGQPEEKVFFEIEDGSLKVKLLASLMFLSAFSQDIMAINTSGTFNDVTEKRAKVFEKWQRNAKNNETLTFDFRHNGNSLFKLNKDSDYKTELNQYVEVEKILYGTITGIGGKKNPNIHLDTEDGSIIVYCSRDDLINQDNRLYKQAAVKVKVKQHISTLEYYGEFQFIEFHPYSGQLKGKDLDNFINQHSKYWEDIPDSAEWQRKLRDDNDF